jgi:cbb3-type cytochrome c oxidase subunit III
MAAPNVAVQRRALMCLMALAIGTACASEPRATEAVARGAQVYRELGCGECHESHFGLPAAAPALDRIGTVARTRRPTEGVATYVRESALRMPGGRAKRLAAADLDALVQYLLSRQ